MVNQEISRIFNNMASYLQMSSEKNAFFRARAYRTASEIIESFPYDLALPEWYLDTNRLIKLKGIGKGTAFQIKEYVETGTIEDYENMKRESPVKLEELLRIQGVGPKKILKLYQELGVTDLKSMKLAAETDQIANLPGFGKKSQDNILDSIEFAIVNKDRVSIATAEEEIENLRKYLSKDKNIEKLEFAGSFRRKKETIGDVDILVCSKDPKTTMEHFVGYQNTEKILSNGETKSSIWLRSKLQVDIRIVDLESFGAALQYFTGSKDHNVKLRNIAISKGYKLSEYGLFQRDDGLDHKKEDLVESSSEEDIYTKLGLQYIPPEIRENEGEIELALNYNLPTLLEIGDIKGDLHTHTTNSDGSNSIIEIAQAALKKEYLYIGIADHFGKLKIAGAIDESEFDQYLLDIREADQKVNGINIYASGEIEIDKEGNLEFDEAKLKELDYIVASVHFATKMNKKDMTERIIKALKNPLTSILAHPTGRLIGQRPGFVFDYEEVFKVAKNEGVLLEINAHPMRLDLNDKLSKMAAVANCKLIINTDAHKTSDLDLMKYGVYSARRGMLTRDDLSVPASLLL